MPRSLRLFIAIDPPRETVVAATRMIDRLMRAGVEAAWSDPQRLHLTLHFLGDDVDDATLHHICLAMDEAAATRSPFRLAFGGVGVFPDVRRPRVVWLGIRGGVADLGQLYDALADRLSPLGFPPEARGYRPHLTLGRFRGAGRGAAAAGSALAEALASCDDRDAGEMTVTRIVLYESRLSREGAEHDRLHASPLPPHAGAG